MTRAFKAVAWFRILLGAASLASPSGTARGLGIARTTPDLDYMTRVFGARAIALGVSYLTSTDAARCQWRRLTLFVDTSDTLAAAHAMSRGGSRRTGTALMAMTGSLAVLDAIGVYADRRRDRSGGHSRGG